MADEVFLPSMPAPDATLDELRTAFRQLLTWAVAREPLSNGGDTEKFVTTAGGAFGGTIQVGRNPQFKGTTMVGSGALFTPEGPFCIGNSRTNVTFDGKVLTLNGQIIDEANLALSELSVSIAGGDLAVAVSNGDQSHGARTATASGGTSPYSYSWAVASILVDNNAYPATEYIASGTASAAVNISGIATDNIITAQVKCTATDANGRTAQAYFNVYATHGTPL